MTSGLVTVNGKTITELGAKADVSRDHIKVAGKLIRNEPEHVYIALHKPAEVVATMSDPEGRKSLQDLLRSVPERVFPTGRMEYHASGLILLTNDGELANRILQEHELPQIWYLKLKSLLTFAEIEKLSRSTGAKITRLRGKDSPWYQVTLGDSRRRELLRNRLFQTGHPVEKLHRVAVGPIELGALPPGGHRPLSEKEVSALEKAVSGSGGRGETVQRPSRKRADRRQRRNKK